MPDACSWLDAVVRLREPMEPIKTTVEPQLQRLPSIGGVIFDVYGTLVISGSGDVGSADETDRGSYIGEALAAIGCSVANQPLPTIDQLHARIRASNEGRTNEGCPKPEVDIVDVWRQTLIDAGQVQVAANTRAVVQLSAEYEARSNPTWPMPAASALLSRLREAGLPMGIVSNAQDFTLPIVEDLLGASLADGGFDLELCVFSNRFGQAKPGPRLFDVVRRGLAMRGIAAHQAVYVGNDMLNDVWAASQAGLKTAWFAGDRRSCRIRDDDPRCRSLRPDVVLTDLLQLLECLDIN